MEDPVLYFTKCIGGGLTTSGDHGRFRFGYDGGEIDAVIPIAEMTAFVGVMLQVLAESQKKRNATGGFPVEAVNVEITENSWTVLQFGLPQGDIPIALDDGQLAELQLLLKRAKDQKA